MISPLQNLYNLRMARALPPAGGAGLSSLPPGPEAVLPAQSTDPIDDGIKTLMAYGRQATGQGLDSLISPTGMPVRRMYDGGDIGGEESGYGGDVGLSSMEGVGDFEGSYEGFEAYDPGVYSGSDFEGSYEGFEQYSPENIVETMLSEDAAQAAEAAAKLGLQTQRTGKDITFIGPDGRTSTYTLGGPQGLGGLFSLPDSVPGKVSVIGRAVAGLLGGMPLGAVTLGGKLAEAILGPQSPADLARSAQMGFQLDQEAESRATGDGAPIRPYGDPYNAPKPVVSEPTSTSTSTPTLTEPTPFFRRQVRTPLTLADIVGYATGQPGYEGGFPRFLPPVGAAQGGGISALAYGGDTAPTGYGNPAFEGMVPGTGTGMSDSVPFSIEGQQPALLSRDEYVLPADVVSQLGDGSSGAGADMLDNFVSQVRHSKYGQTQQPPANGGGLMSALMRHGGIV